MLTKEDEERREVSQKMTIAGERGGEGGGSGNPPQTDWHNILIMIMIVIMFMIMIMIMILKRNCRRGLIWGDGGWSGGDQWKVLPLFLFMII